MLRFFNIPGFEGPIALEISNPTKPMYELRPDKTLKQIDNLLVIAKAQESGSVQRDWSIYTINVSNVTFAVYGKDNATVHALEPDQKWSAAELHGDPGDWSWLKMGAKAALIAWVAAQLRKDEKQAVHANIN